jgi:flavin-binding protein dodecin
MADSVYKIIELVGTSTDSWEQAAKAAVSKASGSLRDLRVAEISELVNTRIAADPPNSRTIPAETGLDPPTIRGHSCRPCRPCRPCHPHRRG